MLLLLEVVVNLGRACSPEQQPVRSRREKTKPRPLYRGLEAPFSDTHAETSHTLFFFWLFAMPFSAIFCHFLPFSAIF